jgi:hypothetical protein
MAVSKTGHEINRTGSALALDLLGGFLARCLRLTVEIHGHQWQSFPGPERKSRTVGRFGEIILTSTSRTIPIKA